MIYHQNGGMYISMGTYTKEEQFELININPCNLSIIDNQCEDICLKVVKSNGFYIEYVKEQTEAICLEAVKKDGLALKFVKEQTPEICLEAVNEDGLALKFVKEQTPEICLVAVKKDGLALQFVKEQTPEICLAAVKENGAVIKFVREQREDICITAIKQDKECIKYIKNKTPKVCFYAFAYNYKLLHNKCIKDGIDIFMKENYTITNENFSFIDIDSLEYLKDYLINKNVNNKYVFTDTYSNVDLLKEIAVSNNELIIIDSDYGHLTDFHKIVANKIVRYDSSDAYDGHFN